MRKRPKRKRRFRRVTGKEKISVLKQDYWMIRLEFEDKQKTHYVHYDVDDKEYRMWPTKMGACVWTTEESVNAACAEFNHDGNPGLKAIPEFYPYEKEK